MFERNSVQPRGRRRRGAAALLACIVAVAGLGVVAVAQPAAAASICDVFPERCQPLPTFSMDPSGALDAPSFGTAAVRVTGWAGDPNVNAPIDVIVTLDGVVVSRATAGLYRADVGYRGFDISVPASPATAEVCVTAVNVGWGSDASIGCAPFPYSTNVTLLDQCGVVSLPLIATEWQLSPGSQAVQEVTPSSAGRIGFMSGPSSLTGSSVGVSLANGVLPGPLFRSGPMTTLPAGSPANPSGRLNVAVPCPSRFTAAQLATMASGLAPAPPTGMTITSTALVPGNGTIMLLLSGTFGPAPFTYALSFTVSPSTDMNNPAEIVVLTPTGPGTLAFGGVWGAFLNVQATAMELLLRDSVRVAVQSGVNGLIASSVASGFPGGLPAGATTSASRIVITPSGVSLTLAVGWFG
ncbi:MAG TPA: hypothetical protein VHI95_12590 [Acidimicrobiales bacterium]|nr:hypothetical protein [Acidimicrobiales bacterium]